MTPDPFEGAREIAAAAVRAERERQTNLRGPRPHYDLRDWICVLAEEVGELSKEVQNLSEASSEDRNTVAEFLYLEAVQTAARAVAIAERFAGD